MNKFDFNQAEVMDRDVELLDAQEITEIEGGKGAPWDAIIENIGELCATAAGFIDGLLGK